MNLTYNFPTILTLIRLLISPILIPFLFVIILPINNFNYNLILALIFFILSLTDFFDGYLARKYNLETKFGKLLDPIADKFLLFTSLISLVYIHKIFFFWAIIFIGREFFVMALREISLSSGFSIPVSKSAKIKTAAQIIYIIFVIINPYQNYNNFIWNFSEFLLLFLALFFTLYSAVFYYKLFMLNFKKL